MKLNLSKIDGFYQSDLGCYARKNIENYLKKKIQSKSKICVGSAGACFYSDCLKSYYNAVCYQFHDEQDMFPGEGKGNFIRIDSNQWPYRAEDIDHVILVHDIEFVQNPEVYLHEAWRVLKGEGQLTIIFPNRQGRWAQYDRTPFGKGYPFSFGQIKKILERCHFAIDETDGLLFFPPYEPKTKIGKIFRSMVDFASGLLMYRPGVYAVQASKHIHAPIGGGLKEMAKNVGRVLQVKPIASSGHSSKLK